MSLSGCRKTVKGVYVLDKFSRPGMDIPEAPKAAITRICMSAEMAMHPEPEQEVENMCFGIFRMEKALYLVTGIHDRWQQTVPAPVLVEAGGCPCGSESQV